MSQTPQLFVLPKLQFPNDLTEKQKQHILCTLRRLEALSECEQWKKQAQTGEEALKIALQGRFECVGYRGVRKRFGFGGFEVGGALGRSRVPKVSQGVNSKCKDS